MLSSVNDDALHSPGMNAPSQLGWRLVPSPRFIRAILGDLLHGHVVIKAPESNSEGNSGDATYKTFA
jgi:hypothetical protein